MLLLTGWTDYAFSGDNVAAHQRDLRMVPPMLQVPDGPGRWRTVIEDIGFPVGRPQTVAVDLTGIVPPRHHRRADRDDDEGVLGPDRGRHRRTTTREAGGRRGWSRSAADLRWRGFSAERTPDGREPFAYDYERVSPQSPWKVLPGRYTRSATCASC